MENLEKKIKSLQIENQILQEENELLKTRYKFLIKTCELTKKKFEQFIKLLPQAVFEMNAKGKFKFINPNGKKYFQYNKDDIKKGLKFWDLFILNDRERLEKNVAGVISGIPNIFGNEYTGLRKDGTTFHTLVYSSPMYNGKIIIGIRGLILDISKRKIAEIELEQSRDQFRNLAAHLQSVREEERKYLAREIHDELGQALTALKIDLIWIDSRIPEDYGEIIEKTEYMTDLLESTIKTIKRISSDLRPGLLDDLGLDAALEWYSDEFVKHTGIQCNLKILAEDISADKERNLSIFRIFQETLTNVARHAQAMIVKILIDVKDDILYMKITDNGIGISDEQINDPESLGLIGLRERVYPWGGDINIKGINGQGTVVKVRIPLKKS